MAMIADKFPKWHILGTGNLGNLWATRFFKNNFPVQLLTRDEGKAYRYPGVHLLDSVARQWVRYPIPCSSIGAALQKKEPIQRLLVCSKAQGVESSLRAVLPLISPNAVVVVLQNGLISRSVASMLEPLNGVQLLAASTREGAWSDREFFVRPIGYDATLVGPFSGCTTTATELNFDSSNLLLPGSVQMDIMDVILWRKLALNCFLNPLATLYNCRNGELEEKMGTADYLDHARIIIAEVAAVAQAQRIPVELDQELCFSSVRETLKRAGKNRCSMLQDVEGHRTTEIEALNGYVAAEAKRLGFSAPRNAELAESIREIDAALLIREADDSKPVELEKPEIVKLSFEERAAAAANISAIRKTMHCVQ